MPSARQEPLLSKRLDLASVPEQTFRPPASSNRSLYVVLVVLAVLLWLALSQEWLTFQRGGSDRSPPRTGGTANLGESNVPQTDATPSGSLPGERPRTSQITKCISSTGVASYMDGVCPAGTRTTTVTVKPDSNLADGMSATAREASMRANRAWAQAQADHERRVAMNVSVNGSAGECKDLEAYILSLDAAARQPLSAQRQDWIRSERKSARDRQFALRCQ